MIATNGTDYARLNAVVLITATGDHELTNVTDRETGGLPKHATENDTK